MIRFGTNLAVTSMKRSLIQHQAPVMARGLLGKNKGDHKTLYEILGVPPKANPDEIKNAYQKIMSKVSSKDPAIDPEYVKSATEAYNTLSDQIKRGKYDETIKDILKASSSTVNKVMDFTDKAAHLKETASELKDKAVHIKEGANNLWFGIKVAGAGLGAYALYYLLLKPKVETKAGNVPKNPAETPRRDTVQVVVTPPPAKQPGTAAAVGQQASLASPANPNPPKFHQS
eukprot:TRINITY_DN8652_c0_g1_i1.p1 TRINITY_DN8652_c0_g1~~TRINITY_DN8652_c0_g1_i1.p1  ORF type:complete len:230 (+),score=62.75 TRINITY_DN8652_c0_g1_i1:121-810(+)